MAVHYRTKGIFLKKSARGEADELFTVYTEDFGKLKILGKAIRKISSKLMGGTGLFYFSDIEFIQGKTYKTLTDAIVIDGFPSIRKDLRRLFVAGRIAEILNKSIIKEEKDEDVWRLVYGVFEKLDNRKFPVAGFQLLYYYFFWNLVSVLGYRPNISGCSVQGRKIDCDIVKILKLIFKNNWEILSRLKIEPNHYNLLKSTSEWYNDNVVKMHEK